MSIFVHEKAICESEDIGADTKIWAFSHILKGAILGKNCNICDGVFIENDVVLGDNVTVKCGVQLWDGCHVKDDVFIGPNVTFTNDKFPRSKQYPNEFLSTLIEKGASIGANATILPGIEIGEEAMIGAGAVVTKPVPPKAIVVGNPARIVGYVGASKLDKGSILSDEEFESPVKLGVGEVELWKLKGFEDLRGNLMVTEFSSDLPFVPNRAFFVYGVPSEDVRGEHAHKECSQFLVCLAGSVHVVVDDGEKMREIRLDKPQIGLHMPTMIWGIQYKFSKDAVLMVMASHPYNSDEYIRDYTDFLKQVK